MTNLAADTLSTLETPAVLVDRTVLERNVARAAQIAREAGVVLRPHAKTHKSLAIARLQMDAGAVGLTVAKTAEAMVFLEGGIRDVTVAHPLIDPRKITRLLEAARRTGSRVRVICNSMHGVEMLGSSAAALGAMLDVLVKVDVGLHRCGVDPAGPDGVDLARAIDAHAALRFDGLLSHAGHAYGAEGPEAVRDAAKAERRIMTEMADRIAHGGIAVPSISVGSTPTVWLGQSFAGLSEIRPGNYVFMDLTQVSLGVASRQDLALSVLATVVSKNARYAIVDAGSKVLSSDRGPHGSTRVSGYGLATRVSDPGDEIVVASLSEEHGFLAHEGRPIAIGERFRIWPNHACPIVNLARALCVMDGSLCDQTWPIEARAHST